MRPIFWQHSGTALAVIAAAAIVGIIWWRKKDKPQKQISEAA